MCAIKQYYRKLKMIFENRKYKDVNTNLPVFHTDQYVAIILYGIFYVLRDFGSFYPF